MSDTNIMPLRPKAKDPTNAQRQARLRRRRKGVVTVETGAPAAPIALPIPPPHAGRGAPTVTPESNGGAGVTLATLTAALALATVSGGFSIYDMTSIFTGALYPVIGMGAALELGGIGVGLITGRVLPWPARAPSRATASPSPVPFANSRRFFPVRFLPLPKEPAASPSRSLRNRERSAATS
jgi:hypothetical protein